MFCDGLSLLPLCFLVLMGSFPQVCPCPLSQRCILHIPRISTKLKNFPLSHQTYTYSPFPQNLLFVCLIYIFLLSPYFDHDACMHHALHVLDAPGWLSLKLETVLLG